MNREQMIEKVAEVIWCRHGGTPTDPYDDHRLPIPLDCFDDASAVVDAILPQVTTVEELEALPIGAAVVFADRMLLRVGDDRLSNDIWVGTFAQAIDELGPLTVVWQPE